MIPKRAFKGVWIPTAIWESTNLTWLEKCLLAEIDSLDDGKGCWATNAFLAERFTTSANSMAVMISKLRKSGWLWDNSESDAKQGQRNRFLKVVIDAESRAAFAEFYLQKEATAEGENLLTPVNDLLSPVNPLLTPINKFLTPHKYKEIPIENTARVGAKAPGHPDSAKFKDGWMERYEQHFGRKYLFNASRDGRAVRELLKLPGLTWETILGIAEEAWTRSANNGPRFNWCKQAVTIYGLYERWNQIRDEQLTAGKLSLQERIDTHPANPEFVRNDPNCTPEQIAEYRELKRRLNER